MIPRAYAPDAARAGETIALSDDEASHLRRVLRIADGDALRVFNGRGAEFDAVVELAGRKGARARLLGERAPAAEPRVRVTLATAVLKGDAMDTVVRDAVMLGVAAVLTEPSALVPAAAVTRVPESPPMAATVLTGPEGGWTPQELDRLAKVAQAVTLGRLTLRAEAAPAVALAALFTRWNAF
jgi:16S rRNA U1498 N3-methylase RsmE